ncbi:major facilitator superfamily domain-containing protein [Aspergillus granulosus]|uniref:Major facilitator superfamily domain-containing protein n=1 Tax=Aspergillus granulosus TaxID=176169 RepID=A0ABR4HEY7_9EURO
MGTEVTTRTSEDEATPFEIPRPTIAAWRLVIILLCIAIGLFLSLMDTTIVSTMLYTISDEYDGFKTSSWIVLAYTLSYVGCAVFMARLSDVIGRKFLLCICFLIFLGASMGCAASKNMNQLIGFRAVQGIGGSGLYAMAMIIYPEISPPALLPAISGIIGVVVALAGISGPLIGGALTSYRSWRWGFWINGPCAFVPLVALLIVWPNDFHYARNVRFRHLDYLGALLILLGSVLLVFILNEAAIRVYAWKSVPVIIIIIISGFSWIALVFWQWFIASKPNFRHIRPQLPFRLLSSRVMVAGFVSTILTGFVMLLVIVNIPLRAQIVNLKDAVASGILLLPLMGGTAVGSAIGGAASAKRNNAFWTLNLASVFMLIGSASLSTLTDAVDPVPRQWGLEAVLGFGIGLSLSTMTFLTTMQVEFQDHAVAQGIVAQLRIFGGSIGIASGFIVFNINVQHTLASVLTPEQLDAFYRTPAAIYSLPIRQQLVVRQVYVSTFNTDMRICAGVAAACLVATLCTYQRKPQSIKQRLADLEEVYVRTEAARTEGER